jgi:phage/plasmid-like protein (TIGR03299 family)
VTKIEGVIIMAAAVESMAYFGQMPWHKLGNVLSQEDTQSVPLTIKAAGLDWKVEKQPLMVANTGTIVPNLFAHVRDKDQKVLGTGTERYTILQNEEAFNWFQPFLDLGACQFETAGSLHDGEVIWIMAKMKGVLEVAPNDEVEKYLLLSHSHNGKNAINVAETPVRVVCANTLAMAKANQTTWGKIKHSKNMQLSLSNARDSIAKASIRFEEYLDLYKRLAAVQCNVAKANEYFLTLMGKDTNNQGDLPTRTANKLDNLFKLFESGKGNTNPAIKGTYWAAYNAVTEYLSHEAGRSEENRYHSLWFGDDNMNALNLALQLAA